MEKINKKSIMIVIFLVLIFGFILFYYLFFYDMSMEKDYLKYDDKLYYKQLDEQNLIYNENNDLIVKNQLIFETNDISKKDVEKIVKEYNGEIVGYIAVTHTYQVEFNETVALKDIIKKLEDNEHIEHISYNHVFPMANESMEYPNDKRWKKDWSTLADGDNWGLEAIHIPEVWDYLSSRELNEINIGVLECYGIQRDHRDLKNNINSILGNYDQTDKEHGTMVSGIIAAEYNNQKDISGITMNKGKIDYFSFYGANSRYSDMMSFKIGLTYLITMANGNNNQTAIINMSLGYDLLLVSASYGNDEAKEELNRINNELEDHLKRLLNNGYEFLIVKAAGNANGNQYLKVEYDENDRENTMYGYVPYTTKKNSDEYKTYSYLYPSNKDELSKRLVQGNCDAQYDIFSGIKDKEIKNRIIVVGATENKGNNQFKLSEQYSVCGSRVDILAPGTNLGVLTDKNKYITKQSGTSFSAPHVTGVAGLILSIEPNTPGDKLKEILIQCGEGEYKTSITKSDRSKDNCNYQMINALNAIKFVDMGENIPDDAYQYNGHHYYVYSETCSTWEEAKEYCESLGGHLAVLNDENENKNIYHYVKEIGFENAYFGFSDVQEEGNWKWVNGEEIKYTNWSEGEPNNERGIENYAMFYYKSPAYEWNDGDFNHGTVNDTETFICEWDY